MLLPCGRSIATAVAFAGLACSVRAHNRPFTAKGLRYASESGQVLLMRVAP